MRDTNLPPVTAQMKSTVMPNRFPPGRHSFSVMDHTTPKSTPAKRTGENREDCDEIYVTTNNNITLSFNMRKRQHSDQ